MTGGDGLLGPERVRQVEQRCFKAIGDREVPIPEHMDIYFLEHEIEASDMSAVQAVSGVDKERAKLGRRRPRHSWTRCVPAESSSSVLSHKSQECGK